MLMLGRTRFYDLSIFQGWHPCKRTTQIPNQRRVLEDFLDFGCLNLGMAWDPIWLGWVMVGFRVKSLVLLSCRTWWFPVPCVLSHPIWLAFVKRVLYLQCVLAGSLILHINIYNTFGTWMWTCTWNHAALSFHMWVPQPFPQSCFRSLSTKDLSDTALRRGGSSKLGQKDWDATQGGPRHQV